MIRVWLLIVGSIAVCVWRTLRAGAPLVAKTISQPGARYGLVVLINFVNKTINAARVFLTSTLILCS